MKVSTEAVQQMRNKSRNILSIMSVIIWGSVLLLAATIGLLIWASFLPEASFAVEQGLAHWSVSVAISEGGSFFAIVPFSMLPPLSADMFSAKSAFITFFSVNFIVFFLVVIYGAIQVKQILLSIKDKHTPFTNQNANRLRNIAYAIIGYSILGDLLVNIMIVLLVTNRLNIDLSNISLSGLIIGVLLLIVSQIFRYGSYLQEEYDTTL